MIHTTKGGNDRTNKRIEGERSEDSRRGKEQSRGRRNGDRRRRGGGADGDLVREGSREGKQDEEKVTNEAERENLEEVLG